MDDTPIQASDDPIHSDRERSPVLDALEADSSEPESDTSESAESM